MQRYGGEGMEKLRYNKAFRNGIIAFAFCILLSSIFIILPIVSKIQYDNLVSNMKSIEATIVDIDLDINVRGPNVQEIFISYEVDDVVYSRELNTDTKISFAAGMGSHYSVGDRIDIFYNPQNPNEIATPRSVDVGYFYMVIGLILLALVMFAFVLMLKNRRKFLVTKEEYEKEKCERKHSKLVNTSGEKIRWQYFNVCIYFWLSVIPAILVMIITLRLKEDNFDIWNSIVEMADLTPVILAVYAVCIGPFIILSILNRFCFGKVLGVINDSILFLNNREININGIIEIVYHPRFMTRNGSSFCYATFVVRSKNGGTESFDVVHFPLYGLKKAKKNNPNIKLSFDKYIWVLMFSPTVILAVLSLLLG